MDPDQDDPGNAWRRWCGNDSQIAVFDALGAVVRLVFFVLTVLVVVTVVVMLEPRV